MFSQSDKAKSVSFYTTSMVSKYVLASNNLEQDIHYNFYDNRYDGGMVLPPT